MSRRGNFSVTSRRDGSRSFKGDHDDRQHGGSFNNYRGGRGNRGSRGRGRGFKNFNAGSSRFRNRFGGGDDDGDETMGEESRRHRGSSRSRNTRGRGMRRSGSGRLSGGQGKYNPEQQWYKVFVPYGTRISQAELFKTIQDNLDIQVQFHNYHTIEQRAYFFVQGASVADSLRTLSHRITCSTGRKLTLVASESGPPKQVNVTDAHKEKLKLCMSDRYDASSQLLNLSSFHNDEALKREAMFLPLNKFNVMEAVIKIIAEYIPEMTALNLSDNKIGSPGILAGLVKASPGLTSLDLSKNQIRSVEDMEKLKGWVNMVEINLDGNDLCNAYNDETDYISAVRKIFPKVVKLDGKDLPPPISFDIEALPLPATQGSYFLNDDVKNLLVSFVKEYYTIFDSDNRRGLMAAYNENAQFSYFVCRNTTIDRQGDFQSYLSNSRNLKKISNLDSEKKTRKVKVGLLNVISALEEFPKTTHDLNSFTVDVMLATPQMLSFVLHGVFKETASRADKPVIRSFSRTFVTSPAGAGISIMNDMLSVSNAGVEQARNAFKEGAPTPSSSPASSSQTSTTTSVQPVSQEDQKKMVETFTAQSGMNPEFSLRCLQENSWDYQRAATNFQELNSQGKIPPEAFVK